MARLSFLLPFLFLSATVTAAAQAPSLGSRVRVRGACPTAPDCPTVTGTLRHLSGDSLVVRQLDGVDQHLRLGPTSTLEYARGSRRHTLQGLGIGAAAGLIMGAVEQSNCEASGGWFCGMAVPGGVLFGGGVGTLIGALVQTTRWERVPHAALVARRVGDRSVLAVGVEF